jgi:signal recognition particle receptor subunit beta
VDGIVFVADSQWEKMRENVESFRNLEENLAEYDYSLDDIPYVLQYNKRDLDNKGPVEYLGYLLNRRDIRVASFESIAIRGQGVFDTLNRIAKLVLHKLSQEMKSKVS